MNLIEKLKKVAFPHFDEEFEEWVLCSGIYVFVESSFTGEMVEIRAMKEDGTLLDREGDSHELNYDTLVVCKSLDLEDVE